MADYRAANWLFQRAFRLTLLLFILCMYVSSILPSVPDEDFKRFLQNELTLSYRLYEFKSFITEVYCLFLSF
jgi:hypothetical protein